jgi:lipopolysaccharide transport system permease protein
MLDALMSLGLLLVGLLYWHGSIPLTALYLPLIFLPLVALGLGGVWILASVGVFIRDIAVVVVPLTAILMYASAIFYPIDKVPLAFSPLVHLNPLALLIDQARRVSIMGEPLEWAPWGYAAAFGLVTFLAGYAFFMRTKRAFADVM